jgi:hypothetical protein
MPSPSGVLQQRGWNTEGQPLDPSTLHTMEERFGHDFGRVRVHTGPEAASAAHGLGAHAYTLGQSIFFGADRYRPDLLSGQALIAHELEHLVRAGPRGPDVPKLQPTDPATDHTEKLSEILTAKAGQGAKLRTYLKAHPDSIEVAERLLAKNVAGKTTVPLLRVVFSQDPKSEGRVAKLIRRHTLKLRKEAEKKTAAMWGNYEAAAYEYAVAQWAKKRLAEEKKQHPKVPRGSPPPEPTAVELQLERWQKDATDRLAVLTTDRKTLLADSDAALEAMMAASEPLPYVQGDVLEKLSDLIHGTIDEAHRERIHSFEDLALLRYSSDLAVENKFMAAQQQLRDAKEAEEKAKRTRSELETPAPSATGAPETPAAKRRREQRLEAAIRAETRAAAKREKAAKALTPEGARDPQLRKFLVSRDPALRAEAEARLDTARKLRTTKIRRAIPKRKQQPGVTMGALLNNDEKWWIYHTALQSLETGFPGYSMEHTIRWTDKHRSKVGENREALGLGLPVSIDTYDKHGPGQYDIHAPAGTEVKAALPDTVDLTRILGSKQKRLFQRVSSTVLSAAQIGPDDGDEDVLAKLVYGFFGREITDRSKMIDFLAGAGGGLRPSPNGNRIIGALVIEKSIANSPPTTTVATATEAIRKALEVALHAELRKLKTPVDIPDNVDILQTVDASSGWFGGVSMITQNAYDAFLAVKPKGWKYTKAKASQEVFKATNRIVLSDATVSDPLKKLMLDLFTKGKGNRSGPWVTLLHKYQEAATGKEAWIEVDYRHLHAVETLKAGDTIEPGAMIAKVGSSGAAISPHVHMAIRVYEKDPRSRGVLPLGHLVPLDFFPFGRKRK